MSNRKFDDVLDCRMCRAKYGGSVTVPIPTSYSTAIQWAVCPKCGACYPMEEEYWLDEHLDYDRQVQSLVNYARGLAVCLTVRKVTLAPFENKGQKAVIVIYRMPNVAVNRPGLSISYSIRIVLNTRFLPFFSNGASGG